MMQGYIVVITRNGSLGGRYPLTSTECLFGQSPSCDVRVYVANVARKHCLITALPNERAYIRNLSPSNTTLVNGIQIGATQYELQHADVITVGDRHFRWEYPFSSRQKTPAKKTMDSGVPKTPTCMVQVPMSVFKQKRHSSPGILRENKIISFTSQDEEEPNPKRRKTLHSVKDLVVEKKLAKPISKQLVAVTQPASSPKSFNTFRVLLKSASKRKSLIPVSKTPNPKKKIISTKVPRSKSLSPQKLSPKQRSLLKHSPVKKSGQVRSNNVSKLNIPPLKSATKKLPISTPYRKSISTFLNKTPMKNSPAVNARLKRYSIATAVLNKSSNTRSPKHSSKLKTPRKSTSVISEAKTKNQKDRTPKTPQNSSAKNSITPEKSPKTSKNNSPAKPEASGKKSRGRPSKTPQASPIRKSLSPSKLSFSKTPSSGSPKKDQTPGKNPRGRPPKTPQISPERSSNSPNKFNSKISKNSSPVKSEDSDKTSKGRPSKTPQASPNRTSASASAPKLSLSKLSPSDSPKIETTGKTPRGRPHKTPQISPSRNSKTPGKFESHKSSRRSSPLKSEMLGRKSRGRPSKSRGASPIRKSESPSKTPARKTSLSGSSLKDKTPGKTPRGRPPKTPQISPSRNSKSPVKFESPKTSMSTSPLKSEMHSRKSRGRPSNSPKASPMRKSESPSKSPATKTSLSCPLIEDKSSGKTPRGRPPKTPRASPTRKSVFPSEFSVSKPSPSTLVKDKAPGKTPQGRPPKTPEISPAKNSLSPEDLKSPKTSRNSSPVKIEISGRRSRGRSPKSSTSSPSRKSESPSKSPMTKNSLSGSPVIEKTPQKTPRDRPKTPEKFSTSNSTSPLKFESPSTSRNSSPGLPGKRSRGTPEITLTSPIRKSVSPFKSPLSITSVTDSVVEMTPRKTPRGRHPKSLQVSPVIKSTSLENLHSPKMSRRSSSVEAESSGRTSRGRPSTPQTPFIRKSVSPTKSPLLRTTQNDSLVEMTPGKSRGRPPKIPQMSPANSSIFIEKLEYTEILKSDSPEEIESSSRTSRGRLSKTPLATPSVKNESMANLSASKTESGPSEQIKTLERTPRGRKPKTPELSPMRKSILSPQSLPKTSHNSSSVITPVITPTMEESKGRTSRGRTSKTPQPTKTLSPAKFSTKVVGSDSEMNTTNKTPNLSEKSDTGKLKVNIDLESSTSLPLIDKPFGRDTNNDLSVTKSARRSAVRSGLSSSKDFTSSLSKPLLLKSSIKQAEIAKLQIDSKRKYDTDVEAKAERAAKRLKMETPKSLTKNKKAALLVCHSPKSQKRPLFSEVLKSHLSTAKKKQASIAVHSIANRRVTKQISYDKPLSLEVPKSFKFNSTGHANSPETIVIRKQVKKTPGPKTRKGRKSLHQTENRTVKESDLEGVPELFKTPKSIISSLKSASSVKKSQNTRVRFSLQNDVQSPSGRRSLVMQSDEVVHFGSPMIPSKKYVGTPRPLMRKPSENSLMHTSIIEESPTAQEIDSSEVSTSPLETSDKSYEFSVYSPSSPTLQLSRISGVSSVFARKSIDFNDSTDSKSSRESSKRKRSSEATNKTLLESSPSTSKRFSFAGANSSTTRNSAEERSSESHDISIGRFPKRISSTPKLVDDSNLYSPLSSPISVLDKRSLRSLGSAIVDNLTEEPSETLASIEDHTFKSPLTTPGKKPRKGSIRMNASNAEIPTPESQVPVAAVKPSTRRKQGTNDSFSSVSDSVSLPSFSVSHDISERSIDRNYVQKMMDSRVSGGLDQPRTSRSTTSSILDDSVLSNDSLSSSRRKRKSSTSTSIQSVDATTFDFTSAATPKIPKEMFVSPIDKVSDDLTNISGVKRILSPKGNSPVSSYEGVGGIKKLFKIPNPQNDLTDVVGVKRVMSPKANSPISSYIDVKGVKRLLKTPRSQTPLAYYSSIGGIKELFKNSPVADYTNVVGVKNLYSTSVEPNYMNVKGVRRIFKETKLPNSPDLAGVEVLFESPKKLTDEYNQLSSYKPIGMVPPMSRDVSGTQGGSLTKDNHIEENRPSTSNSENTVRRRTSRRTVNEQSQSKASTNLRKSKRANPDLQSVPEAAAVLSLGFEKDSSKNDMESGNNMERSNTRGRRAHNRTQSLKMGASEQELPGSELLAEKDVKVTRKRGKPKLPIATEEEKEDIILNTKKEHIEFRGRNTRRKAKSPPKLDDKSEALGSISKSQKLGPSENVQSADKEKRTRRGRINEPSDDEVPNGKSDAKAIKTMESEPFGGAKRKVPRRGIENSMPTEPCVLLDLPGDSTSKRLMGKSAEVLAQEGSSKSVKQMSRVEPAKTTTRKGRNASSKGSATKLVPSENNNSLGKKDLSSGAEVPSTNSLRQDDGKKTRRRVQFNMYPTVFCTSPSSPYSKTARKSSPPPSTGSPKKKTRRVTNDEASSSSSKLNKTESPVSNTSPKKTVPAKRAAAKTKAKPKLKAAARSESPVPSPSPKSTRSARKASANTKAAPSSSPAAKTETPASSPSPKSVVPAMRVATRTKAAPKQKAATKAESPAPSPSPKRTVPAKKVATKTKAAPKLKAAAKAESPARIPSPKKAVPVKKGADKKTKAAPKSKVAAKAESPVSSPPPTRVPAKKGIAQTKGAKAESPVQSPLPKEAVPVKKGAGKTKAVPKTKVTAKTASPAPSPPGRRVPAKKIATKTKAAPKLKAAAKRKSSTPIKSPPAKRVTRARK